MDIYVAKLLFFYIIKVRIASFFHLKHHLFDGFYGKCHIYILNLCNFATEKKKIKDMNRVEEGLKNLGKKTEYRMDYAPDVLETFQNKHTENDYWVKFNCPEFTSLCPITGQPDYAEIVIRYIPDQRMVESKSLKLYLFSFRNHGDFHEDCVNTIMKDLIKLMEPRYIEVIGYFLPRGGISIHPFANFGRPGTKYEQLAEKRMLNFQ